MKRILRIPVLALGLAAFVVGSADAQLSKTDQNCVNEINKGLQKVVQTVNKEQQKCVKDQSNGKVADADDCIAADAKGKVGKATDKAEQGSEKKCTDASTAVLQDFFGSDVDLSLPLNGPADVANAEAISKETRLMLAFLGSDISVNVVPKADKDAAKCQQAILKDLFKCEDTKLKEFNKCKKTALKDGALTAADVETACMGVGEGQPDEKGKIKKACGTDLGAAKQDKLAKTAQKKCIDKGVSLDDVFSSYGGNPSLTSSCTGAADDQEYLDCLERFVECDVCSTLNATDGMNRDCDVFDDGLANNSCGDCRNAGDQAGIEDIQSCVTACPSGDTVCSLNCITSADLSSTCSDCFVLDVFSCAAANCLGACSDATADDCLICLNVNSCLDCLGETP